MNYNIYLTEVDNGYTISLHLSLKSRGNDPWRTVQPLAEGAEHQYRDFSLVAKTEEEAIQLVKNFLDGKELI
jgi:hypothetical protein